MTREQMILEEFQRQDPFLYEEVESIVDLRIKREAEGERKLWVVTLHMSEPVLARDRDEALIVAKNEVDWEGNRNDRTAKYLVYQMDATDMDTMDGVIPWGEEDNRTCEEIMRGDING